MTEESINTPAPARAGRRLKAAVRLAAGLALVLLVAAGAGGGWLLHLRRQPVAVPILMYHKIGDGGDSPWWVTRDDFAAQVRSLHEQGYRAVTPDDLAAHRRWGKPLPPKPVVLTFDDGYLNAVTEAEPILAQYGFRAIVYLITEQTDAGETARGIQEGAPCLTWPEVRAARERGTLVFGSHTHAHANLAAIANAADELCLSRDRIREHLGRAPRSLCYPFGQYRDATVAAARTAGYTTAMTCREGIARIGPDTDLLQLERVSVGGGARRIEARREPDRDDEASRAVSFMIEGPGLEAAVRLCTDTTPPGEGWRPWQQYVAGEREYLRYPAGPESGPLHLELWDKFRVLRLYRLAL